MSVATALMTGMILLSEVNYFQSKPLSYAKCLRAFALMSINNKSFESLSRLVYVESAITY